MTPYAPMLARLADELPAGPAWVYEPKWDGFRALCFVQRDGVLVRGRGGGALELRFPDVVSALRGSVAPGTVLDGELVAPVEGGVDFDGLLRRLEGRGPSANRLAEETPVVLAVFDVLADEGRDVRAQRFDARRVIVERICAGVPSVALTPQSADIAVARAWLTSFAARGIEGVVAKRVDQAYAGGKRATVKVKVRRTIDCVVGGFRGVWGRRGSLVLGLHDHDGLRYVGQTSLVSPRVAEECGSRLAPIEASPFARGRPGRSRWSHFAFGQDEWVPCEPDSACEVAYTALSGGTFRHAVRFLRWRPDKPLAECRFDQLPAR